MPTNKHAQLRYKTLDRCFSDFEHYYTIEDLLREVNEDLDYMYGCKIALRQLRQDISDMQGSKLYCAPIETHKIQVDGKPLYYYRYSDSSFSIFKTELKADELKTLRSAIEMLGKYRGAPANIWLEDVITNLEFRFGIVGNSENLISFDQNPQLKGLQFLSDIIDATIKHTPLDILYRTHQGYEKNGIIHPYHVKQYNNRWFLFGLLDENDRLVNRALDRIEQIRETDIQFKPNKCYDFNHYFDRVIGVSVPYKEEDKQPFTIILKFSSSRFPYVLSKPLHRSQIIVDSEDGIISICVIPTREFEQQILSYGPDVEVLSPFCIRNKIRKKIEENLKKYLPVQKECTAEADLCSEKRLSNL